MSWSKVAEGKYRRPIGENETFIKLIGDAGHALSREHWAINSTATFAPSGTLAEEDLSALFVRAWKTLRFEQPSIAVYVSDDDNLAYDVPDDAATLDRWASETFRIVPDKSAEELISGFKPSPYATLTYLPMTNELMGHTAHWRTDGIGVLLLLDAFLALVTKPSLSDPSQLSWGKEPPRLAPSVEEAASIPVQGSPEDKALGQKYVETFSAIAGAVGIKYHGNADTIPGGTRSAFAQLSVAETKAVIQACKTNNITVTAAVHAALAGANYAMAASEDRGKHYTSTIRFSLRPYLPVPYSGPEYASGLYTTGWMKAVAATASWKERAQSYQDDYQKGISSQYISAHREYARGLSALLRNIPQGGDPPASDVDISSLGVIEKLIRREFGTTERGVQISRVSVGVEILTRQSTCFVWTFRDQLFLNAVFNESFHTRDEMEELVGIVKRDLIKELGV